MCLIILKELQNDLEAEQVKVNSLTHMVVVVDENSGESATAVLEEQLQVSVWPDCLCGTFVQTQINVCKRLGRKCLG